jgi:hypothetical protein
MKQKLTSLVARTLENVVIAWCNHVKTNKIHSEDVLLG